MSITTSRVPRLIKGKGGRLFEALRARARGPQRFSSRNVAERSIEPLPTKYGGKSNVTILPGTGVGPEIMESTLKVLMAAQAPLSYEILHLSFQDDDPESEFQNALTSIIRNRVALKGSIELKGKNPHAKSRNILLRKTLNLFAYVLHCKTYRGLPKKFGEFDITVLRQNTEGEYLMLEHQPTPKTVESLKVITRSNSKKIAEFAFKYALENGKKRITIVHSTEVHAMSEGLFVEAALDVARNYPSLNVTVMNVGVAIFTLPQAPGDFDIILATNLNGSMLSNFLTGMVGGPGLSSGTNFAEGGLAVFEPGARNKGSSIVGMGVANPLAMISAAVKLLNHLGYHKTAQTIEEAITITIVQDKVLTQDLGGKATTEEITEAIIKHVKKLLATDMKEFKRYWRYNWKSYSSVEDDLKKS